TYKVCKTTLLKIPYYSVVKDRIDSRARCPGSEYLSVLDPRAILIWIPRQVPVWFDLLWWSGPGLNRQPSACKADALPIELPPRSRVLRPIGPHPCLHSAPLVKRPNLLMVGLGRVELPTSPLSGARSSQLSYRPSLEAPLPALGTALGQEPGGSL